MNAETGAPIWTFRYPAIGNLDYGNSPRATPLIHADHVFLFGAFGHLHCVERASGKVTWATNLRDQFGATDELKWGTSASPLIVDGKLIVNPGAEDASLVALDPATGKVIWQTPGGPAAFSSFIVGVFGGKRQIVGYDKRTLGGWDIATGKRLWSLTPPNPNDFNVPTPIALNGKLLVTSENNGTRIYDFNRNGTIIEKPIAEHGDLACDTHTPVLVGRRLFGVWNGMYCLDVQNGLKELWFGRDPAFFKYAALIASPDRLMAISLKGELILIDPLPAKFNVLSRMSLFVGDNGVYAHPALVGTRLYVRGSAEVVCVELGP